MTEELRTNYGFLLAPGPVLTPCQMRADLRSGMEAGQGQACTQPPVQANRFPFLSCPTATERAFGEEEPARPISLGP